MEYTSVPNLNKPVSRIGLGTWSIGGWMWGGSNEKDSIATILKALHSGITLIDTAAVYGFGLSEELVGKALQEYKKREEVVIATKCGLSWKDKETVFRDSHAATVERECEASLKRLKIDYIDIYQIHWPDPSTPIEETAEALLKLLNQGKIKAIGVSNFSVEQMETFRKTAPLHTCQPPFNLFDRQAEHAQLAYCLNHSIATFGYSSLYHGLLTGKIDKNTLFKGDDLRKRDPKFQEPLFSQYLSAVQQLDKWAKETYNRSILALAIRWTLDKGISAALWGARKPEQLDEIKSIWNWQLTPQDMAQIDQILSLTLQKSS